MNPDSRPALIHPVKRAGRLALAFACAAVLARQSSHAATLYWDGSGNSWDDVGSWSELDNAPVPDPLAVPGAADIATFVSSTALTAQTVNLNANQAALGLATNVSNTFLTTI